MKAITRIGFVAMLFAVFSMAGCSGNEWSDFVKRNPDPFGSPVPPDRTGQYEIGRSDTETMHYLPSLAVIETTDEKIAEMCGTDARCCTRGTWNEPAMIIPYLRDSSWTPQECAGHELEELLYPGMAHEWPKLEGVGR